MQLTMKDVPEYFHRWAAEDLCSQCKCQHFQRRYVGNGRYRSVCAKDHDASDFVKECDDYLSVKMTRFQLWDLKMEKKRLEERE